MYKFILSIFFSLAFIISGCSSSENAQTIGSGTLTIPECKITAPAAGKIQGLILEENERISKDQPLFAVVNDNIGEQTAAAATKLAKAKAELKEMESPTPSSGISNNLPEAQAAYDAAKQNADKMNYLLSIGAVSQKQAQAAQSALAAAEADLNSASQHNILFKTATPATIAAQKELVQKLQQEETELKMLQSKNEVLSPFTGIILKKYAENNANVTAKQDILYLKATDSCMIALQTDKNIATNLTIGQKVMIKAVNLPSFEGQIQEIHEQTVTVISENKPTDITTNTNVTVSFIK